MDIFSRMAQTKTTDLSVFRAKHSIKTPAKEMPTEEKTPTPLSGQKAEQEKDQHLKEPADTECMKPAEDEQESATVLEPEFDTEDKGKLLQFKKPENLKEEAAVKLESELETTKNTLLPVFPIVRYLKNKCLDDEAFAVLVNDERKTLEKCFSYVTSEVKKALNGHNGWLDDNEVYAYAETYYMTDEAVFEQIAAAKAEEEKKRRAAVAKKRQEQEEKRQKADKKLKKKEPVVPKKEEASEEVKALEAEEQPVMQEQLCLQM